MKMSKIVRLCMTYVSLFAMLNIANANARPGAAGTIKKDDLQWVVDTYNSKSANISWATKTILKDRSTQDKKFFNSHAKSYKQASLPKANLQGNKIVFTHEGKKVSLEIVDASKGIFLVEGRKIDFSNGKSMESIYNELNSVLGENYSLLMLDLLFPRANANPAFAGTFIVIFAAVMVLAKLLMDFVKKQPQEKGISFLRDIKEDCNRQKKELLPLAEKQAIRKATFPAREKMYFKLISDRMKLYNVQMETVNNNCSGIECDLKESVQSCFNEVMGILDTIVNPNDQKIVSGQRGKGKVYPSKEDNATKVNSSRSSEK